MKTIVHSGNARDKILHVEAEGCVVNIQVGLTDHQGRKVTSIQVVPDRYVGEEWHLDGYSSTRVIEGERPRDEPSALDVIRHAALAFLHGEDPESLRLEDLADALGVPHSEVEGITFPATEEQARLCQHGNKVWRGHECGECEAAGSYVWADRPCAGCENLGRELNDKGYCPECVASPRGPMLMARPSTHDSRERRSHLE